MEKGKLKEKKTPTFRPKSVNQSGAISTMKFGYNESTKFSVSPWLYILTDEQQQFVHLVMLSNLHQRAKYEML